MAEQQQKCVPRRALELAGCPVSIRQISDEVDIWMNNVMKEAGTIGRSDGLASQHKVSLDAICNNLSRLQKAKNNLLDCLLAEANELTFRPASCRFRDYMVPAFKQLSAVASRKGVTVAYEIDNSIPEYLVFDAPRLRQVLFNIIGNAVARTNKGVVKVTAAKSTDTNDDMELDFSVTNTSLLDKKSSGPVPYQCYREINNSVLEEWTDATGLTRAITKQLIGMMGGQMRTSPDSDQKSVLHFTVAVHQDVPKLATIVSDISKFEENRVLIVGSEIESERFEKLLSEFPLNTVVVSPTAVLSTPDSVCPAELYPKSPFEAIIVPSVEILYKIRKIRVLNTNPVILSSSDKSLNLSSLLPLDTSSHLISARNDVDLGHSIHKGFASIPLPTNCRVLAAEPDKINRMLLKKVLDSFGEPTVCEDGRQAFGFYTKELFDLVLLEFAGPRTYGEAAAKKIRDFERKNDMSPTPLIALAPRSFRESGITIPEVFDGFVEIPIWKRDLSRQIIAWIRKHRSPEKWE